MADLHERSKRLVGGQYRLEVAHAIHDAGGSSFSASEIAEVTGIRYPRVQEDLKRLVEAGMIVEQPSSGNSVEYVANESVYWEMCSQLVAEAAEEGQEG